MSDREFPRGMLFLSDIFILIRSQIRSTPSTYFRGFFNDLYVCFSKPEHFSLSECREILSRYITEEDNDYFNSQTERIAISTDNESEAIKYKIVVIALLKELVKLQEEADVCKIYRFVDIFHNFPKIITQRALWNPKRFWKEEVAGYRKEFGKPHFLMSEQQKLRPTFTNRIFRRRH